MSFFNGEKLKIEIYGTSHADKIGVKVWGFPRLKIDCENLKTLLKRRSPSNGIFSTKRKEPDEPIFEKCKENGVIDGDFEVVIYNKDVKSSDYNELYARPRPSHADLVRYFKFGEKDYRGGGEFSARLTAPLCVVGALCKQYLKENFGIEIFAYLSKVGKVKGRSYKDGDVEKSDVIKCHEGFPCLSNGERMLDEILIASNAGDSVGGVVECIAYGVPSGVGGSLFEGLEGKISNLVYSIPAVKGVEFGDGFDIAESLGSVANDPIQYENGKIKITQNKAGGINGGISNGNPIALGVAFRPTPSIAKEQNTVDLDVMQNVSIKIKGRHDSCVAVRAVPVVECTVAIALLDCVLKEKTDENDGRY